MIIRPPVDQRVYGGEILEAVPIGCRPTDKVSLSLSLSLSLPFCHNCHLVPPAFLSFPPAGSQTQVAGRELP